MTRNCVQHEGRKWFKGVAHGVAQSVQAQFLQRREGEFRRQSQLQDGGNIMKSLMRMSMPTCMQKITEQFT
jgi:hypothetical protein